MRRLPRAPFARKRLTVVLACTCHSPLRTRRPLGTGVQPPWAITQRAYRSKGLPSLTSPDGRNRGAANGSRLPVPKVRHKKTVFDSFQSRSGGPPGSPDASGAGFSLSYGRT